MEMEQLIIENVVKELAKRGLLGNAESTEPTIQKKD